MSESNSRITLQGDAPSSQQAILRYEAVQSRLPSASFPQQSIHRPHLEALTGDIDCFVLDGFGVLNVGDAPVPGALERVDRLRQAGCTVRVLTNGASFSVARTCEKYRRWGIEFEPSHVVSSRDALAVELRRYQHLRWGFMALPESDITALAPLSVLLDDQATTYATCEGFVLLGSQLWSASRQALLVDALGEKPRPVLVGNPDLVAPHAAGLSREPGLFAHALADDAPVQPQFFGKPFDNAFALVRETLSDIPPERIAMVGDTLHTDILGGAQAGWKTVLVTDHGLLKGQDTEAAIQRSGIRPDYIVPTT